MIFTIITSKLGGYNGLRQYYNKSNSKIVHRILKIILHGFNHETNSYLPFKNTIKGLINFLHRTYGIFISGGAKTGTNCTICHQVTIGSNMLIDSNGYGYPTIRDNCLIGAGAKIIGNV